MKTKTEPVQSVVAIDDAAQIIRAAVVVERERCVRLIKEYLRFDSQRAVSWHEVQDCLEAIRGGK